MPTERARLLELALENLISRKKQIDLEIDEISRELGGQRSKRAVRATSAVPAGESAVPRKRSRFSKEERLRRSARMKAYWDNWRKQKKNHK